MNNLITKTTELAMNITLAYISPGDIAIDATCGAGHDTLALASAVGKEGRVYAFDIQDAAISLTGKRVRSQGFGNVTLITGSFVSMGSYVPSDTASAVVFNLGYLPGGDHSITTEAETTVKGLDIALRTIRPGGIITVVLYDGHPEGSKEKKLVLEWAESLDPGMYHSVFTNMLNQKNDPPEILWVTKKLIPGLG